MFLIASKVATISFVDSQTNVNEEKLFMRAIKKWSVKMRIKGKTVYGKIYADEKSEVNLDFEKGLSTSGVTVWEMLIKFKND